MRISDWSSDVCSSDLLNLIKERRGVYVSIEYLSPTRMLIKYELPLAEMVVNFYDRLKSVSKGYATLDYHQIGRASCRERVCQYVSISVVAGSLKTQKQTDRPLTTTSNKQPTKQ